MILQRSLHDVLHDAIRQPDGHAMSPAGQYAGRAHARCGLSIPDGRGFSVHGQPHASGLDRAGADRHGQSAHRVWQAIVIDPASQGVRPLAAADSALAAIDGITVRPFPMQQASATNYGAAAFGAAAPLANGALDVLRSGYIMTTRGGATPASKAGSVDVWVAASSGSHVQSGFEAAPTAGSTIARGGDTTFNGAADAASIIEIAFIV
jgi:hypothetical protein